MTATLVDHGVGVARPGARVSSRFLCRVAAVPTDVVDQLAGSRCAEILERIAEIERRLDAEREAVSQALFEAVGAASERQLRQSLIKMRRDLYNGRRIAEGQLAVLAPILKK